MKIAGIAFMILSALLLLFGFTAETSIATDPIPASIYAPSELPRSVVNIGLLQKQMILIELGIGSLVAGILLFGFGSIRETIERSASRRIAAVQDRDTPAPEAGVEPLPPAEETERPFDNSLLGGEPLGRGEKLLLAGAGFVLLSLILLWVIALNPSSGSRPSGPATANEGEAELDAVLDEANAALEQANIILNE